MISLPQWVVAVEVGRKSSCDRIFSGQVISQGGISKPRYPWFVGSGQALLIIMSTYGKWSTLIGIFVHFMFSHISGNKIGWEKTGSHSEPQARGDPGDQTKVVSLCLLFSQILILSACSARD